MMDSSSASPSQRSRRSGSASLVRRAAASLVGVASLAGSIVVLTGSDLSRVIPASIGDGQLRRRMSEALPNGGCFVTPSIAAPPGIKPVFAASYPGSGARMTWNLIEALTGIVTGDDWNSNGWGKQVVSVKTHFPHAHGRQLDWENEIERAFVVVRNPVKAIPSFHNFLYEFQNKLENHSLRAPVNEWIRWRDNAFSVELQEWKKHISYYMDRFTPDKRLVVPYEDLTSEVTGPRVSQEMVRFFSEDPVVTPISEESAPCVWGTVVNYQSGKQYNTRKPLDKTIQYVGAYPIWPGSKRKGDKERPLTQAQIDEVIRVLQEVKVTARDRGEETILFLMQRYINEIRAEVTPDQRTAQDVPPPQTPAEVLAAAEQQQVAGPKTPEGARVQTAAETLAAKDGQPKAWSVGGGVVQAAG
mmetsp:Transcript_5494/g.15986  ORF Transcript_5494/g.15986 Transcript_5494/m.15986 type:complete len:415 (-) Transcript_5494:128-1372(-)|eukprot:CAMPEP_0113545554 /NCGR_PEP_ID=MMETSP0015_2-20120614/11325_1 /TAXON_ID=2838 /ORGANISM="Odontella" /LENGTH=414 /DNA_ID=CAMNT_0000445931 /DNA_START=172 /DNA_END=1419 /DNA_ORIENTATION=+ /assembly_acc=CAM_ASM_000160